MASLTHNPEKRLWRGRSYRKGGRNIRELREKPAPCDICAGKCECTPVSKDSPLHPDNVVTTVYRKKA